MDYDGQVTFSFLILYIITAGPSSPGTTAAGGEEGGARTEREFNNISGYKMAAYSSLYKIVL